MAKPPEMEYHDEEVYMMFSVEGYFDGTVCIPLAELPIRQNQRVIITVVEEQEIPDGTGDSFVDSGLQLLSEITGSISGEASVEAEKSQYFKEKYGYID